MDWLTRAALACLLLSIHSPVSAQTSLARPWKLEAELGANLFFGASKQGAVLSRGKLEHKSARWELKLAVAYDYGEAQDGDGLRFVNKRSWLSQTSIDYLPQGIFNPFVFGIAEGSLQRQIEMRRSGGAGARVRFIDNARTLFDFSVAGSIEHTRPRINIPGEITKEAQSIGRWSARLGARHRFAEDRMQFDLVSFYKPSMDDFGADYTVEVTTSVQYALTSMLSLKLSLVDVYDNLAVSRGAPSNNDGQLFFGLLASVK